MSLKTLINKIVCLIKGHQYPNTHGCIDNFHLYYCQRCQKEMFDRGLDDIAPMPQEDWENEYNIFENKDR